MFDAIKRLFGAAAEGGGEPGQRRGTPSEHKGFTIIPAPRKQGTQWLTGGFIAKDGPDGPREREFIRSDLFSGHDEAEAFAVVKARQIIDEQGERLFEREWP